MASCRPALPCTLLNLAVALAAMLVFFLVQAGRARWRRNCNSFAVRLVVLVLLTGAYALRALLAIDRASDENARVLAMIVSSVGTLFLYFIWLFTLLPGEKHAADEGRPKATVPRPAPRRRVRPRAVPAAGPVVVVAAAAAALRAAGSSGRPHPPAQRGIAQFAATVHITHL